MFVWGGGTIAWALALAWMADVAASRGRSQIAWIALAVVASVASWLAFAWLVALIVIGVSDEAVALVIVLGIAPFASALAAPLALGAYLKRLPVKLRVVRLWPVSCRVNGEGKLEITTDAVRLIWKDRTQDIPRAGLRRAAQDGECLRLEWDDGELVLFPMLAPQTRDGRMQQSLTLARMLAPKLPMAIQIDRS